MQETTANWNQDRHQSEWHATLAATLRVHLLVFVAINAVLVAINLLTTPGTIWFLWPLWAWGVLLAAHAAAARAGHPLLAAHAAVYVVTNLGLLVIDVHYSERRWFFWPLLVWGFALLLHAAFTLTSDWAGAHGARVARRASRITMALLLALTGVSAASAAFGGVQDAFALRGSGTVASVARPVGAFDAIVLRGDGQATITQGATDAVSVEWDDNLLSHVRTHVSGGRLTLSTDEDWFRQLKPTAPLRYRITVRNLARIELHDDTGAQLDRLQSDDLTLDLNGDSRLTLARLDGRTLRVSLGGNAAATIQGGTANDQTATVSGNATYHAAGVTAQVVTVNVGDNGRAEIGAQQTLDGRVAGNGAVRYAGTPRVLIAKHDNGSARPFTP